MDYNSDFTSRTDKIQCSFTSHLNFPKEIKTRFFHIPSLKILPNYARHTWKNYYYSFA